MDFRKGIDTLAALCRHRLNCDPFSGTVFLFRNRRGTALKLLIYDGQGFWLCREAFLAWTSRLVVAINGCAAPRSRRTSTLGAVDEWTSRPRAFPSGVA
ncbi:MAG: IS66 family insertion sequence element accessory protein TnpB [Pyrinomonadaceae bacterium MAG19_C2-C3]|nr:IS66 family insertion sequence element accessory protein TnpB [Pyrinomonadaceae bacterium MAG19_C2-C3]